MAVQRVPIMAEKDIVHARREGRQFACAAGFRDGDQAVIATAISQLSRYIALHAPGGEVCFRIVDEGDRRGLVIEAHDGGTIPDVDLAHERPVDPGGGLEGALRIMDEFQIRPGAGRGAAITMTKWAPGVGSEAHAAGSNRPG